MKALFREHLIFAAVLLVTLLSCAGIALPYPILAPLFMDGTANGLNQFMGISPQMLLGMALASYPLGMFVGGTFIGALSDSYGRKHILSLTLLLSVGGYLVSAWAVISENYLLFLASRFLTGMCEGNIAIVRAIALDLSANIDKTRAMSLISASTFLGWLVGPLAGGYLAIYGSEVAFYAAAGGILFCWGFVMLVVGETHKVENDKSFMTLVRSHNSLHLLKVDGVRRLFIFQFVYTMGLNAFYEFYPVWLVMARDYTSAGIGNVTAVMTICMTLTSVLVITKVKRTIGLKAGMVAGMVACVAAMILLPISHGVMMFAVFSLAGAGIAMNSGLLPVLASESNPDLGSGALMGLLTIAFFLSNVIIALIGSYVLTWGAQLPLFIAGAFIGLSAIMLIQFVRSTPAEPVQAPA